MKILRITSIIIISFLVLGAHAQEVRRDVLYKIAARENQRVLKDSEAVSTYMFQHGIKSRWVTIGNKRAYLRKVENGLPYYISTGNLQARKTTGIEFIVRDLGNEFKLEGQGITVGVWDGGKVLENHVELLGRVINKSGTSYSDHATHVTGTIIASGVKPDAKGMAPQANVMAYYAFEDDLTQMALEAANGLILSNHSYGLILGWDYSGGWQWYGGTGDKDLRFGHYSVTSAAIDDIVYNAPNYTIVWAVGNDRNDTGDGSKSPDGPYSIIDPSAAAKNILSVGAITGFDDYSGPESVVMSAFSCWGPTNDGRIKPDLVADGVAVLSSIAESDSAYDRLQGTSMATPNVTGSLVPLQEFYFKKYGKYLTAAALKSLVIHTAREAGVNAGPDAQFGWGVLNTVDALKVLNNLNTTDTLLINETLIDQTEHQYRIFSDGVTPITATMAWTDPPGVPGTPGNTNIMLQNDLDLRIIDDDSNIELPWSLSSTNYQRAEKKDNDHDNVEKVEFFLPDMRNYRLVVSHKGSLVNGSQKYSLILTGKAIKSTSEAEYYWIGSGGDLNTINNWSSESGGSALVNADLSNSTLVFDNNSGFTNGSTLQMTSNLAVDNFIWLTDSVVTIDLGGNTLVVSSEFNIQNNNLSIQNGIIKYSALGKDSINLNFNGSDNCVFEIASSDSLVISDSLNLYSLRIISGSVSIENQFINLSNLQVDAGSSLMLNNNNITIKESATMSGSVLSTNNYWLYTDAQLSLMGTKAFNDIIEFNGTSSIEGKSVVSKLIERTGTLSLLGSSHIDSLVLEAGAIMNIAEADTLTIVESLEVNSTPQEIVSINGLSDLNKSVLLLEFRKKLCFENMSITNIDHISNAIINVGTSSIITNTLGIEQNNCDSILYPNFILGNNRCTYSLIELENNSEGPADTAIWSSDRGVLLIGSDDLVSQVYYETTDDYQIRLKLKNELSENSYAELITISETDLPEVTVVRNSSGLVSDKAGDSYQWYLNGKKLAGETARALLDPIVSGNYQVMYTVAESQCMNRISSPFNDPTLSVSDNGLKSLNVSVYPNPFDTEISLSGLKKNDNVYLFDGQGVLVYYKKATAESSITINMLSKSQGLYLMNLVRGGQVYGYKLLKSK